MTRRFPPAPRRRLLAAALALAILPGCSADRPEPVAAVATVALPAPADDSSIDSSIVAVSSRRVASADRVDPGAGDGRDLYELSPLSSRLRWVGPLAAELAARHWGDLEPGYDRAMLEALVEAYDERTLAAAAREQVARRWDERFGPAALAWLRSAAGFAVNFAEATTDLDEDRQQEQQAQQALTALADERIARVRRLLVAAEARRAFLDRIYAVGRGVLAAMDRTRPVPRWPKLDDLDRDLARERAGDDGPVTDAMLVAETLHVLRDVDDEDLAAYVAFSESDAGRWYHRVIADSLSQAVRDVAPGLVAAIAAQRRSGGPVEVDPNRLELADATAVRLLSLGPAQLGGARVVLVRYLSRLPQDASASALGAEALAVLDAVAARSGAQWDSVVVSAAAPVRGLVHTVQASREFLLERDGAAWSVARELPQGLIE